MNNTIEQQKLIIDELVQLLHISAVPDYDTALGIFELYLGDDGSASVQTEFSCEKDGARHSFGSASEADVDVMGLVLKLHALMKAHTGGTWTAFTIAIGTDKAVKTNFNYE